jgi:hypothetical protein
MVELPFTVPEFNVSSNDTLNFNDHKSITSPLNLLSLAFKFTDSQSNLKWGFHSA